MTNVEALKEVYVALGGSEESFSATTNSEAISAIASKIPSALAGVLPAVKAADEGKVLKVDSEGKWAVGTDEIQA